jgi:hypothetical protein
MVPEQAAPRVLSVRFREPRTVFADDVSGLLYDTVLLHDAVVLSSEEYDYEFSQYFYRRNGRPVREVDRLRLGQLHHESPLLLETIALNAAAFWTVARTYEWLRDWPHRRRKTRADADFAEAQAEKAWEEVDELRRKREREELDLGEKRRALELRPRDDAPPLVLPPEAARALGRNDSRPIVERQVARLARSPLEVESVESRTLPPGAA